MKHLAVLLAVSLPVLSCAGEEAAVVTPKPDPNVVQMGLDAQKSVGLAVAPAATTQLTEYLRAAGTVQPIDSRIGDVRPLGAGRVVDVLARAGDRVANGQPLARIDNIEAGEIAAQHLAAHAELQKLKVQQANADRQVERSRNLAAIGAVAQKELELAHAEAAALAEAVKAQDGVLGGLESKLRRFGLSETDTAGPAITTIRSPFAGVVIAVDAAPGDVVDSDADLFSIADLAEVWVQAEVYERDLGRVRTGQSALISVETYPGEVFSGTVSYVSDTLDPKTRTARVRAVVPNRDRRLKLDMLVAVDVPTSASRRVLAVPQAAVQLIRGKPVVFVQLSPTSFQVREIQVGQTSAGQTEVRSGLTEKEPVVVTGAYHLKSVRLNEELAE